MKLWVACETRVAPRPGYQGYAVLVDWGQRERLATYRPPPIFDDTLPEGATGRYSMGVRQVLRRGNEWYVGLAVGVIVLDDSLKEKRRLSNIRYDGGHVLCPDPDGVHLWHNSNITDSLVKTDSEGSITEIAAAGKSSVLRDALQMSLVAYGMRDFRRVSQREYRDGKAAGKWDQLHINHLQFVGDRLLVTSCRRRAIFELRPDPGLVFADPNLADPHDFRFVGEYLVVNDSRNARVVIYDAGSFERRAVVKVPARLMKATAEFSRAGWTRGMLAVDEENVLVGLTPLGLLKINLPTGGIVDSWMLSDDARHSCHGLTVVPEGVPDVLG